MKTYTKKEKINFIKEKITHDKLWAYRALMRIFMNQTNEERNRGETLNNNKVGFTGLDAKILTSFALSYQEYGGLTEKQLKCLYNKIGKYATQLYNGEYFDEEKLLKAMSK